MIRVLPAPSAWRTASSRARARGAGQQQVGDVGTGDEKNQRDDGHENLQRLGVCVAQIGEAASHGFQLHVRAGQPGEILLA